MYLSSFYVSYNSHQNDLDGGVFGVYRCNPEVLAMSHVHKAQESRPAVKGFAEFTSCSLTNKENESLGDKRLVHKVNCTRLQYTYPVRITCQ